ncbi:MAG: hypothetical protein NTY77_07620 [Elusimicrobia bacterium]|nr:hypothetical protein [Elusimicrobiota bacterium]
MPRRILILLAVLWLPLAAGAASRRRKPVAVPKTSAADAQALDQTYELVFQLAGQSYLRDELMPDPDSLDALLAALRDPELGKAQAKKKTLAQLVAGAECVQGGPGSISPDVYKLMVDQAAEDLQVGVIVERGFAPDARSGRSLDAAEKALVKACQGEARDQAYDRRGFYQKCLGRRRCEAVYLSPERLAEDSSQRPPDPSCAPVLEAAVKARAKLPAGLADDVGRRLQETRDRLLAGTSGAEDAPPAVAPGHSPRQRVPAVRSAGAAPASRPEPAANDLQLAAPPLESADLATGVKLAKVAKAGEIGFTGYCYSYVKAALEKAGIVDRQAIDGAGASAHAKLFADFVEKNPALLKRKLRRIPEPSWPVPIGTIVVWSAGACGYSAQSGHIEIVTRIKPPQACSDGCAPFQTACLDEFGSDPQLARSELAPAQEGLRQAQADYDAGRTKARLAALRKKKASLAAVQKRLEPRVAAYVIEREKPPASPP